jgi:mannose-1-phosphate guanylyltransferase
MDNSHVFAVLLAGGGGTRLWPKSRNKTPKQFLKLTGKKTMMQVAADRTARLVAWDKMIVVTNKLYFEEVHQQLPLVPVQNIIAEPEKRDTALAMLTGALFAKSQDPEAIVMNSASDHVVMDETEYVRVMQHALTVAAAGEKLVTVGITPTFPHVGFGYIQSGQPLLELETGLSLYQVESFREKPDLETAKAFIQTGKYYWNANMYVWKASTLQAAFATYMPSLFEITKNLDSLDTVSFHQALAEIYAGAEAISIDYAISEKASNLVLIPGDFGWNDVGDWKVVYDLSPKDEQQNVVIQDSADGKVVSVSSQGNLIHTDGRLIALAHVNDMIVVDTDEIIFICPKEKSQDVKKLVEKLKESGAENYL